MARVFPEGWQALEVTGAALRQIETLKRLATGLSDEYVVYHSVHWTCIERGFAVYGEVDFVVVNRAGEILLIEQKSGFLEEGPDGLTKRYPGRTKNVATEIARTLHALGGKLAQRLNGHAFRMEHLLYCPDYSIRNPVTAGLAPERIIDATRRDTLIERIEEILRPGDHTSAGVSSAVHRFFADTLQLDTDVSALLGRAQSMVTRISGGLAHWGRKLHFSPYRLRVTGTAGSGKTQLALAEYRSAVEAGKRPLYLCYNRPLADHMAFIAPPGGMVCTFHSLCDRMVRAAGFPIVYGQPSAFDKLVEQAAELTPSSDFMFDTVIVDEGQDFEPAWRPQVFRHARPGGRLIWLEDPMQNLYGRAPFEEPGWVQIEANANYRCPRPVVRMLQSLIPDGIQIEAASPFDTPDLDFISYHDAQSQREGVKEAIRRCFSAGFRKTDVVVVSFRGHHQSELLTLDKLGSHTFRRFTGRYDLLGHPQFSDGDILLESVYRFKGQSAPAVVLAEVDFEELDEKALRKFLVGATRAMMKLVIVLSDRAARKLDGQIEPFQQGLR